MRKTVIVKLCREALRDREIAMSLALPLDEIERPCSRDMQAAALAARERVALEKGVGVSDAVRRVRSRRERRDAVDVELQFAAGAFDPGVLHEIGRRLRELRRHVFERLHRRPDLAELDRADMSACVVRRAELGLAQPGGEARLAQPSAELAQRGRLRGDAAPPSARGHGAKRYAGPGVASTPNRQHDMADGSEPDDGRIRRILEMRRVDEAQLPKAEIHEHRVRAGAAGEEADALQQVAVGHAGRDEAHVATAREVIGAIHTTVVDDAHLLGALPLLVAAELEAAQDLRPQTLVWRTPHR